MWHVHQQLAYVSLPQLQQVHAHTACLFWHALLAKACRASVFTGASGMADSMKAAEQRLCLQALYHRVYAVSHECSGCDT